MLAFPRHYFAENRANRQARDLILKVVTGFGYKPSLQGDFDNIVITSAGPPDGPFLLLGAHYDSVPGTPGADDNASAVAVCLECARLIKRNNIGPVIIVFFNREEDRLQGSREFVAHLADQPARSIREAHILEMFAYLTPTIRTQRIPQHLHLLFAPHPGHYC